MSFTHDRKAASHARILDVTARAIRRTGLQGVGVADLMKAAGLTHGGFYAHFQSRDALLVEALAHAGAQGTARLLSAMETRRAAGQSPWQALVHCYLADEQLTQVEEGCVVAALCTDVMRQSPTVREEGQRRVQALVEGVRRCLQPLGRADEAEMLTATLVGTLQLARALDDEAGLALLARTRAQLAPETPSPLS